MYQIINQTQFIDEFKKKDRDNFSYEGYIALYDWLDDLCSTTEAGFELDVIGICCDFTEYDDFKEFYDEYKDYCDEHDIRKVDDISEHTSLIKICDYNGKDLGNFIIQQF